MIRDDPDAIACPNRRMSDGGVGSVPGLGGDRNPLHLRAGPASLGMGRPRSLPRRRLLLARGEASLPRRISSSAARSTMSPIPGKRRLPRVPAVRDPGERRSPHRAAVRRQRDLVQAADSYVARVFRAAAGGGGGLPAGIRGGAAAGAHPLCAVDDRVRTDQLRYSITVQPIVFMFVAAAGTTAWDFARGTAQDARRRGSGTAGSAETRTAPSP